MSDRKQCKGCKLRLTACRFQRRSSAKDGLNAKCKSCTAADAKKRREANAAKHTDGPSIDTKACSRCKTQKPASSFSSQPTSNDGLADYCKSCRKQAYAEENPPKPKKPKAPKAPVKPKKPKAKSEVERKRDKIAEQNAFLSALREHKQRRS